MLRLDGKDMGKVPAKGDGHHEINFKNLSPGTHVLELTHPMAQPSTRRFTFKVRYDFMNEMQKTLAFYHFFGFKGVSLKEFEKLTPADFDLVKQKAEILDCLFDKDELINMLRQEYEAKEPLRNKMGF